MRKLRENLELGLRSRDVRKDICLLVWQSPSERDTNKEVSEKGLISKQEGEGRGGWSIKDLTWDWSDHIIKFNNLTIIKLLTGTILKAERDATNNYIRQQAPSGTVPGKLGCIVILLRTDVQWHDTLLRWKTMMPAGITPATGLHCFCRHLSPQWTLHCLLCLISN